ncbi:MAG: hypothetical protein JWP87_3615 [Labilithrix sp.]|nr:hypothetical protein [Labilithrix sp.]
MGDDSRTKTGLVGRNFDATTTRQTLTATFDGKTLVVKDALKFSFAPAPSRCTVGTTYSAAGVASDVEFDDLRLDLTQ